jgi:hypothetical protein
LYLIMRRGLWSALIGGLSVEQDDGSRRTWSRSLGAGWVGSEAGEDPFGGGHEGREVVGDGGPHDAVGGVEVAVREAREDSPVPRLTISRRLSTSIPSLAQ